jgi:hypothetical protein
MTPANASTLIAVAIMIGSGDSRSHRQHERMT